MNDRIKDCPYGMCPCEDCMECFPDGIPEEDVQAEFTQHCEDLHGTHPTTSKEILESATINYPKGKIWPGMPAPYFYWSRSKGRWMSVNSQLDQAPQL